MESYDGRLLQEVQSLCKALNLSTQIKRLFWLDKATGSKINSDDCRFALDLAVFPDRMRERLDPTEWRPLIASALIYRRILSRQLPGGVLLTAFITFWILVIGGGVIGNVFGSNAALPFYLYAALVAVPFGVNGTTRARKKQRLQADREATKIVGREQLSSVLRKIDEMSIPDVLETEKRRFRRHFSSKPSVAERLENLRSLPLG